MISFLFRDLDRIVTNIDIKEPSAPGEDKTLEIRQLSGQEKKVAYSQKFKIGHSLIIDDIVRLYFYMTGKQIKSIVRGNVTFLDKKSAPDGGKNSVTVLQDAHLSDGIINIIHDRNSIPQQDESCNVIKFIKLTDQTCVDITLTQQKTEENSTILSVAVDDNHRCGSVHSDPLVLQDLVDLLKKLYSSMDLSIVTETGGFLDDPLTLATSLADFLKIHEKLFFKNLREEDRPAQLASHPAARSTIFAVSPVEKKETVFPCVIKEFEDLAKLIAQLPDDQRKLLLAPYVVAEGPTTDTILKK